MKRAAPPLLLEAEEEENLWDDVLVPDMRAVIASHLDPLARWMFALTSTSNRRLVASCLPSPFSARQVVWEGTHIPVRLDLDTRTWDNSWLSILGAFGSTAQIETYLPSLRRRRVFQSEDPDMLTLYLWRGAIIHRRLDMLIWLRANAQRLGLTILNGNERSRALAWAFRMRDTAICQWLRPQDDPYHLSLGFCDNPYILAMAHDTEDVPFLTFIDTVYAGEKNHSDLLCAACPHIVAFGCLESAQWLFSRVKEISLHNTIYTTMTSAARYVNWPPTERVLDWLYDSKHLKQTAIERVLMFPWWRPVVLLDEAKRWCQTKFPTLCLT